jgi:hypothetical protein
MEIPSILQEHSRTRLLQVIVIGAVATLVIGFFSWGGWVTGTKAPSPAEIVQFDFNSLTGTKAKSMAPAAEASGKIQSEAYRQVEEVRGAADAKANNR